MSDRNERIRAAFHEETDSLAWNRDRVLAGVLQHGRNVRRQRLFRRTAWAIAASLVLGIVLLQWSAMRSLPVPTNVDVHSPAILDSISHNPAEEAVSPQQGGGAATTITVHEAPQSLMPLLGHRSSLSSDLRLLIAQRDELAQALNANPGRERADGLRAQIAGTDADIAAVRTALRVVDNQLAALQGQAAPAVAHEAVTISEGSPIVIRGPLPGEPFLWASGISLAAVLVMFTALLYFRRAMRAATEALTSLQGQASTQLSALTSGIEAIAIEVERLGENQRFLSKTIAGEKERSA